MKTVQLFFQNGILAHETRIPPFDIFPDVILWQGKYFILKKHEGHTGIYEICFAISISKFEDFKSELSKDNSNAIIENIKAATEENENSDLLPVDLDEAVDLLDTFYQEFVGNISEMTEDAFMATAHHGCGQFIRNNWMLWWYEEKNYGITEKPKLIEYFNSIGIVHADDISSIILKSWYRKITNIERDIPGMVEEHQAYWRKNGFSDGIPKWKS